MAFSHQWSVIGWDACCFLDNVVSLLSLLPCLLSLSQKSASFLAGMQARLPIPQAEWVKAHSFQGIGHVNENNQ